MKFKLEDLCEFQKGYAFKSKDFVDNGEYIVKVTNLTNDSVEFVNCVKISYEKAEEYKKYELNNKDIIITTVGSWPNNPNSIVGKVVRVPNIKKKAFLNQNAVRVRGVNINQDFLYYLLRDKKFSGYLIGTAQGSASQASITQKDIKDYTVDIPDNNEQKAIAKILSDLDEKIEVNNKINKNLEEMAQAIFKQLFVDFEFPNEEGKPYKSSGGEMVESELGMIPTGWKCCSLSEIVEISTKSEKPFENKNILYEHFSLPACDNGKRVVKELGSLISSNKYKIDNNSILISKMNPTTKRIWNPLCKSSNAICSTEFIVYKPKLGFAKSFCYEVINSKRFTDFLVSNATGSTGSRQRVKPKETLNYRLVLPKANVITNVAEKFESIHLKIKLNIEENEKLEKLRDTLLPKLMSGEIRVPLENSDN